MSLDLPNIVLNALDPDTHRVGVAVSGGGDSIALLHAAVQAGFDVSAITVDHNLRPESGDEALGVARICADLNVAHHIAFWDGSAASGNLYDAGRRARFALIGEWARANGIHHVLLGHTQDDEAETFLMRVGRSAGLDGLSGMRPRFVSDGVTWHRPMLSVGRTALRDWLRELNIAWIDDPTNDDPTHERVRVRRALGALAQAGVTAPMISRTVAHLASANDALDSVVNDWCRENATQIFGEIALNVTAFRALHVELARRVLVRALMWVAHADYAPRSTKVMDLLGRLLDGQGAATLHGCALRVTDGHIHIRREQAAVASLQTAVTSETTVWDGWCLSGPAESGLVVAPLGSAGMKQFPDVRRHRAALRVGPAVWRGDIVVAAPFLGVFNGWKLHNLRGSFIEPGLRR